MDSYVREHTESLFNIKRVTLNVEKLAVFAAFDLRFVRDANLTIDTIVDKKLQDLIVRLCTKVPVFDGTLPVKVKELSSIWQMVKSKYAPNWFINKYPLKYTEVTQTIVVKEIFPQFANLIGKNPRYIDVVYRDI